MSDWHPCGSCSARYHDPKAAQICCVAPARTRALDGGKYVLVWTVVMAVVWFVGAIVLGVFVF